MILRPSIYDSFAELLAEFRGAEGGALLAAQWAAPIGDGFQQMPAGAWAAVLEEAALRCRCPDFGLRLAARESDHADDNPFTLLLNNAGTLEEALHCAARISRAFGRAYRCRYRLPPHAKKATFEYELVIPHGAAMAQAVEFGVAILYHRFKQVSKGAGACEIWFEHGAISPEIVYQRHLPTTVRFNQPTNALVFHRSDLSKVLPNSSSGIFKLAKYYIEDKYPEISFNIQSEVERVTGRLLRDGRCSLEIVSAQLGLHPRTLQRKLSEEGSNFFKVKDNVQRAHALALLSNAETSFKDIAAHLGYSDTAAFTRSCRRWFSSSPRKLRAELCGTPRSICGTIATDNKHEQVDVKPVRPGMTNLPNGV